MAKKNGNSATNTLDSNSDSPMATDETHSKLDNENTSDASDEDSKEEESGSGENSGAENSDKPEVNGNEMSESNDRSYEEVLASPSDEGDTQTRTLINSLIHFTRPENLCASNAYECEECCAPNNKKVCSIFLLDEKRAITVTTELEPKEDRRSFEALLDLLSAMRSDNPSKTVRASPNYKQYLQQSPDEKDPRAH